MKHLNRNILATLSTISCKVLHAPPNLNFIISKSFQNYSGNRARRSRSRSQALDLDTVSSSELDLSVDLQLRDHGGSLEVMEMESSSCQTLLQPASASSSKAEFKPKGILKNSKTSENFRLGHEILKLSSDT